MAVQAPRPRLPSLNALRAFEAAGRHGGFVGAAQELGVTSGAVAQQVKHLEDWLGADLFERQAHGVVPTAAATDCLPALIAAFDALGLATRQMLAAGRGQHLQISALPCIAQLWLGPRLRRVKSAAQVSLTAAETPPNFARDLYDLAFFYVAAAPPGMQATVLAEDSLFPVCAPPLAEGLDLTRATLLHDLSWRDHWARWLAHAGVAGVDDRRGPAFSLYSLALEAAIAGDGVLIGRQTLVGPALADGRLVAPFHPRLPTGDRLAVLRAHDRPLTPAQAAWLDAIVRQA
jgi:LysR family glycine cleavage system transcriptional activator